MDTFVLRAEAELKQLELFLGLFSAMIGQQRSINAQRSLDNTSAALLKQMLHAQAVVEDRRRDLVTGLSALSAERFVHELWSLAGDMAHFDFEVSHLAGFDTFLRLREDISIEAMTLTKDLSEPTNMAAFIAELVSHRTGL